MGNFLKPDEMSDSIIIHYTREQWTEVSLYSRGHCVWHSVAASGTQELATYFLSTLQHSKSSSLHAVATALWFVIIKYQLNLEKNNHSTYQISMLDHLCDKD